MAHIDRALKENLTSTVNQESNKIGFLYICLALSRPCFQIMQNIGIMEASDDANAIVPAW